ncbi:hypothetical protein JCM24511_06706 [Saitozyma sp. JCM 24511]|nr:hypothetical protein JCM24511_06706 [Saitozyma sp. JCM 24511]
MAFNMRKTQAPAKRSFLIESAMRDTAAPVLAGVTYPSFQKNQLNHPTNAITAALSELPIYKYTGVGVFSMFEYTGGGGFSMDEYTGGGGSSTSAAGSGGWGANRSILD